MKLTRSPRTAAQTVGAALAATLVRGQDPLTSDVWSDRGAC
ncbi:hypothetical protein [Antribacter gilvus]|nr:hypothetical protein [Antribacter gilvus]